MFRRIKEKMGWLRKAMKADENNPLAILLINAIMVVLGAIFSTLLFTIGATDPAWLFWGAGIVFAFLTLGSVYDLNKGERPW